MKIANKSHSLFAFTILEIMIAIFIFALVLTAIYSTWFGILKGTKSGTNAAATVQRSRIAMRALEDAFLTMVMFHENIKHYYFYNQLDGDFSGLSMVSRLPATFPGVGRYGDQIVRRVEFHVEPNPEGGNQLVMSQAPMLMLTNTGIVEPYSLVLAKDVSLFVVEFYDVQTAEWLEEWVNTNQLPRLVRFTLGQGKSKGYSSEPQDVVTRVVAVPTTMAGNLQTAPPIQQGGPGGIPGGNPGGNPGGFPGGNPGGRPGGRPGGNPGGRGF
jgi:type II secretory pathway pseudopilin PulG